MHVTPEIVFDNMEASEAVAGRVREKFMKLEKLFGRMTHARCVIEAPHRHHHKGNIYLVKLVIGMPGTEDLVISQSGEKNHAHEDIYVAVRDAFDAARRRLQDTVHKRTGKVKTHEA